MLRPPRRRRTLLALLLLAIQAPNLVQAQAARAAPRDSALRARARGIHDRVLTLDTHVDIDPKHFGRDSVNFVRGVPKNRVDLPKMRRGGLNAAFLVVYTEQTRKPDSVGMAAAYRAAMAKFAAIRRLTDSLAPNRVGLARTAADARAIVADGRTAIFIGVENGLPIGQDLRRIRQFADLGARYFSMAHNGDSQLAESHTGDRNRAGPHPGLSPLGREAVTELNRWGVMVDVSHVSRASMMQTVELSEAPVIASHSGVRALCDHTRNLDDDQIRALARSGGVIQIVALGGFIRCAPPRSASDTTGRSVADTTARRVAASRRPGNSSKDRRTPQPPSPRPRASVKDVVDHIDYVRRLVGIDHVGIASDFDGGGGVEGWRDAGETFNVTLELVRRGYSEEDISKIWGGNLLRVLDEVQQVSARLQRQTR